MGDLGSFVDLGVVIVKCHLGAHITAVNWGAGAGTPFWVDFFSSPQAH